MYRVNVPIPVLLLDLISQLLVLLVRLHLVLIHLPEFGAARCVIERSQYAYLLSE